MGCARGWQRRTGLRLAIAILLPVTCWAHRAIDELQEEVADEEFSSAALSAAYLQLHQTITDHVRNEVPTEVKQMLHEDPTVEALENFGIDLAEQVHLFAITNLHLWPVVDDKQLVAEIGTGGLNHQQGERGSLMEVRKVSTKGRPEERLKSFTDKQEGGNKVDDKEVKAYSTAYDKLFALAKPAAEKSSLNEPLSQTDVMEYRRRQLTKHKEEYDKWLKQMTDAMQNARKGSQVDMSDADKKQRMSELFDSLMLLKEQLGDMAVKVTEARSVDWESAKKTVDRNRFVKVLQWTWKHMKATGKGVGQLIGRSVKRIAKAFVWTSRKKIADCSKENAEREEKLMEKNGINTGEIVGLMNSTATGTGTDTTKESKMKDVLKGAATKANKALDEEAKASGSAVDTMNKAMIDINDSLIVIKDKAANNEFDGSEEELANLTDTVAAIDSTSCRVKGWSLTQKLRDLYNHIMMSIEHMVSSTIPNIGFRGVGGAASVFGGGFEEVIDFWNKEIALYAWGSASVTTGAAQVGVSGYAGVGWKGYKLDWNMQDTYSASKTVNYGFNSPWNVPFLPGLSFSGTLALDADSSVLPWVVDHYGTHGISVGWGLSWGLSLPGLPSMAAGYSQYKMFTSECFDGIWSFLGAIWSPHCWKCSTTARSVAYTLLRTGIKVASFPVLSDLLYSYLAMRVHAIRLDLEERAGTNTATAQQNDFMCPKEERTKSSPCLDGRFNPDLDPELRCSPTSTKFNDLAHLSRMVATILESVLLQLHTLNEDINGMLDEMQEAETGVAPAEGNVEMFESPEMIKLIDYTKKDNVGCRAGPSNRIAELPPGLSIATQKESQDDLLKKDEVELRKMCEDEPECKKRIGYWGTNKDKLVRKLMTTWDKANTENAYGTCKVKSDCGENMACVCKSDTYSAWEWLRKGMTTCPGQRGHCLCAPGYCWTPGGACVQDVSTAKTMKVEGMRAAFKEWVFKRELDIGSHAVRFQELAAGP